MPVDIGTLRGIRLDALLPMESGDPGLGGPTLRLAALLKIPSTDWLQTALWFGSHGG